MLHSIAMFLMPRVWLLCLSFLLDLSVFLICKSARIPLAGPLLTLASSWVTLVFSVRLFSNTFETILLALTISLVFLLFPPKEITDREPIIRENKKIVYVSQTQLSISFRILFLSILLGFVISLGLFTRITFSAFLLVLAGYVLWFLVKVWSRQTSRYIFSTSLCVLTGLILGIMAFVLLDTSYFGEKQSSYPWSPFQITPANGIIYNSRTENLAEHGIHPRFTHFIVNMPLLFGPLLIAAFFSLERVSRSATSPQTSLVVYLLASLIIFSICGLSIFPHQEPRFLIPLLVPLCVIGGQMIFEYSKMLKRGWYIFNVVLLLVFGILHQGGVVPSLLYMNRIVQQEQSLIQQTQQTLQQHTVIYWNTYMPPSYLVSCLNPQVKIEDSKGGNSGWNRTVTRISEELTKNEQNLRSNFWLAAPASTPPRNISNVVFELTHRFGPHLSTENFPMSPFDLTLNLYRIRIQKS